MTVVVVEQADAPGGYAHSFRHGPYVFDPAIHVTLQGHDGMLPDALYRHLGIRNLISSTSRTTRTTSSSPVRR